MEQFKIQEEILFNKKIFNQVLEKLDIEKNLSNTLVCRFCHQPGDLKVVCSCQNSSKYAHTDCLGEWIDINKVDKCKLCREDFNYDYCPNCEKYAWNTANMLLAIIFISIISWLLINEIIN